MAKKKRLHDPKKYLLDECFECSLWPCGIIEEPPPFHSCKYFSHKAFGSEGKKKALNKMREDGLKYAGN